jgi:hypothetical protein
MRECVFVKVCALCVCVCGCVCVRAFKKILIFAFVRVCACMCEDKEGSFATMCSFVIVNNNTKYTLLFNPNIYYIYT